MKLVLLILALLLGIYLTREKALSSRGMITEQNTPEKLVYPYQYPVVSYPAISIAHSRVAQPANS